MLQIKRRLLTAFFLKTDKATERINQIIKAYFCQFVSYAQDNWLQWLSLAVSAICGRVAAFTGVSPFFLSHRWAQTAIAAAQEAQERYTNRYRI
jgi:hypothetical protein